MDEIDKLVREETAFQDWADMLASLDRGYVPTLRDGKNGSKLALVVKAHGFRVFKG